MASYITRVLTYNKVALKTSAGKSYLWLAPWPEGRELRYAGSSKYGTITDPREEKRIADLSHAPVTGHVDLRIFKAPSPTPEAILAWVERFIPAALKVQQDLTETRKALAEAEAKLAGAQAQAASPWAAAAEGIANLLSGTPAQEDPTEGGGSGAETGDEPGESKTEV